MKVIEVWGDKCRITSYNVCYTKLLRNLFLTIGDEDGFFSDNYFDLFPGLEVTVHLKTALSKETLDKVLALQTLDSTY